MGAIISNQLARSLDLLGVVLIVPVKASEALVGLIEARIELSIEGPKAAATQTAFKRTLLLAQMPEGYKPLSRTVESAKRPRYQDVHRPLLIVMGSHDKTSPRARSEHILQK
ncbi:hypothetical protein TOPH_05831 [Tolypocladium ophioglossoides CBS 100239]|uniref:Peptidase S9 prolyl oligopeptidase catalytic domain-containing protein n=1 Tax=Tolypocladium ophioglossoides (strain CBS 100239) TaxID=1163406 RepID=A0A0L0N5X3_TOLOC|nr:hypothetical protein TOPH_05831 [Tolypocladium ophioglossoides CBS 100239]